MIAASIITTCKGRLAHLRQTLPYSLAQVCDLCYEVLVVDYGDPEGTWEWCRQSGHATLSCLRVLDDVERFHFSRAKNCGAARARGEVLAFVDAEIQLPPHWLAAAVEAVATGQYVLYRPKLPGAADRCGTCAVSRRVFHLVRGYDESFRGYGFEDLDFYGRCQQHGPHREYDYRELAVILHSDASRTRFCEQKDKKLSGQGNRRLAAARQEPVNPAGYGLGRFELWRPPGNVKGVANPEIPDWRTLHGIRL